MGSNYAAPGRPRRARRGCKRAPAASVGELGLRPTAAPAVEHPDATPRAHGRAPPQRDDLAQGDALEVRRECGDHWIIVRTSEEAEHENEPVADACTRRERRPEIVLIGPALHIDRERDGMIREVEGELRCLLISFSAHPL